MPAFDSVPRRRGSCIGWQCLTAAEQFGVIFSSIVVFLVLSLVYMYCLGKAVTYRRSRQSTEPSRHANSGATLGHAAHVQILPPTEQYPAGAVLVPTHCNRIAIPLVQAYARTISPHHQGIPVAASTNRRLAGQSMPESQPSVDSTGPSCQQSAQRRERVGPDMTAECQTMSRWRQLLNRALRLPLGKARTIYSESNPSSSTIVEPVTGGPAGFAQQEDVPAGSVGEQEEHRSGLRSTGDGSAEHGCHGAETDSIATNAATVHSDDFQMLSPPSTISLQQAVEGSKSVAKGMQFYQSHYIPSTSSIRTHG